MSVCPLLLSRPELTSKCFRNSVSLAVCRRSVIIAGFTPTCQCSTRKKQKKQRAGEELEELRFAGLMSRRSVAARCSVILETKTEYEPCPGCLTGVYRHLHRLQNWTGVRGHVRRFLKGCEKGIIMIISDSNDNNDSNKMSNHGGNR